MRIECIFIVLFFFNTLSPNTAHCSHQHDDLLIAPTTEHNNPHANMDNLYSLFTFHSSLFSL
ncbi:MAG: hypothetical protein ACFN23_06555, partial [Capnocytophaga gingivalis]